MTTPVSRDRSRNNFPNSVRASIFVIPAQAGNQLSVEFWFPACAGMTGLEIGKLIRDYSREIFMTRILAIFVGVLLCATTVWSDETPAAPSDAAATESYKALIDAFAEDGSARESARGFIALAEQFPKSPVAVDSLVWVVTNVRRGKDLDRATTLLASNHVKSERLAAVCQKLPLRLSRASEGLLRVLRAKSPHKDVRAQASFYLARYLRQQLLLIDTFKKQAADRPRFEQFYGKEFVDHLAGLDTSASLAEVEAIYEDIAWKFANMPLDKLTMGRTVRRELYAIRNLSVGRTAPEISGIDVDGRTFKLSDYRGKVVLLDFWGHW
jgi:hypothetical protein